MEKKQSTQEHQICTMWKMFSIFPPITKKQWKTMMMQNWFIQEKTTTFTTLWSEVPRPLWPPDSRRAGCPSDAQKVSINLDCSRTIASSQKVPEVKFDQQPHVFCPTHLGQARVVKQNSKEEKFALARIVGLHSEEVITVRLWKLAWPALKATSASANQTSPTLRLPRGIWTCGRSCRSSATDQAGSFLGSQARENGPTVWS